MILVEISLVSMLLDMLVQDSYGDVVEDDYRENVGVGADGFQEVSEDSRGDDCGEDQ